MGFSAEQKGLIRQTTRIVGTVAIALGVASEHAPASSYQPLSADQPQKHSLVLDHNPFTAEPASFSLNQPLSADQPLQRPLVAGGTPVNPGDFPSLVATRITYEGMENLWCTASVVSNYCVKIAAHCGFQSEKRGNDPFARDLSKTGEIHSRMIAFPGEGSPDLNQRNQIRVAQAYISPDYPGGSQVSPYDTAYYQTERPIALTSVMTYATFPGVDETLPLSTPVHFVGYGFGSHIQAQFGTGHTADCPVDNPNALCIKEDSAEVTPGDSGSPLHSTNNHVVQLGNLSGIGLATNGEWRAVYASTLDPKNAAFDQQMKTICQGPSQQPSDYITDNQLLQSGEDSRVINGKAYAVIDEKPFTIGLGNQVTNHTHAEKPDTSGMLTDLTTQVTVSDTLGCVSDAISFETVPQTEMTSTQTSPDTYAIGVHGNLVPFINTGLANVVNIKLDASNPACDRKTVDVSTVDSQMKYNISGKTAAQQSNNLAPTSVELLLPEVAPSIAHSQIVTLTSGVRYTRYELDAIMYNPTTAVQAVEFPNHTKSIIAPGATERNNGAFITNKTFLPVIGH